MQIFSSIQKDALTEIFNIGLGQAADTLSLLVEDEVQLSIPAVRFHSLGELYSLFSKSQYNDICAINQDFSGDFGSIMAKVFFPKENVVHLSRVLLKEKEIIDEEIGEFERETLLETGNIILNSCMGNFVTALEVDMQSSKPIYKTGQLESALLLPSTTESISEENFSMVLMHLSFMAEHQYITGHIVFLFDLHSIADLQKILDQFIKSI